MSDDLAMGGRVPSLLDTMNVLQLTDGSRQLCRGLQFTLLITFKYINEFELANNSNSTIALFFYVRSSINKFVFLKC